MELAPVVEAARGGGVGRAAADAIGVLRGYADDGGASLLQQLATNRNLIRFATRESVHPQRLSLALHSYRDALGRQEVLFRRQRVDDVTDAMRHANASALVVDRLVGAGARPTVAADFMRRLGRAHEFDSELTGVHRAASEAMDLHNNELGIELGLAHRAGARAGGEGALEGAVLNAIAEGRALVLDAPTAVPRPATADDLLGVLRDPSVIAAR